MGYRDDNAAEICFFCDERGDSACTRCDVPLCREHATTLCTQCETENSIQLATLEKNHLNQVEDVKGTIGFLSHFFVPLHLTTSVTTIIVSLFDSSYWWYFIILNLALLITELFFFGWVSGKSFFGILKSKLKLRKSMLHFNKERPLRALPPPRSEEDDG